MKIEKLYDAILEVIAEVLMTTQVVWDVTSHRLVDFFEGRQLLPVCRA
jgi:hypothetical protein